MEPPVPFPSLYWTRQHQRCAPRHEAHHKTRETRQSSLVFTRSSRATRICRRSGREQSGSPASGRQRESLAAEVADLKKTPAGLCGGCLPKAPKQSRQQEVRAVVRSGVGCECRVTQKRLRRQKFFLHLATSICALRGHRRKDKTDTRPQDVCVFLGLWLCCHWCFRVELKISESRSGWDVQSTPSR